MMKTALLAFLKKPTTMIGFAAAVMFQLIFSVVWMTGYDGASDNVNNLKIAIVNEDAGIGRKVTDNLKSNLPFQVETFDSQDAALKELNERKVQMVIRIPGDFTQQLQTPDQHGELQYTINESNASLIKSVMSGIAANVTATVNKEAVAMGASAMLTGMKVPDDQAADMAESLSERVTSNVQYTNKVDGMNNQMVPMMMVLASYVGAMLMSMNMEQSSMAVASQANKWRRFAARGLINIVGSVIIALVGSSMVMALGGQSQDGFFTLWMFQTLFVMTFLFVSQIFLLLFGAGGMLFNILMLSAQLVTSGAMVPRELLSDFYYAISNWFPATYAVEGNMNLLFGGPGLEASSLSLLWIMLAAIAIGAAAVAIRKERGARTAGTARSASVA